MDKIFISYRREDSEGFARSLFQSLVSRFGEDHVFMDVEAIGLGMDFVEAIEGSLADCGALLVLIGKGWVDCTDSSGKRRLDKVDDFVRTEVAKAIERDVRVIPVMVKGAQMPKANMLPKELQSLARRQARELRHERWDHDVDHQAPSLEKALGLKRIDQTPPIPAGPTDGPQPPPPTKPRRYKAWYLVGAALVAVGALGYFMNQDTMVDPVRITPAPQVTPTPAPTPKAKVRPAPTPAREPAPAPTPTPAPAVKPSRRTSLTGIWFDVDGARVEIVQTGMTAVSQAIDPATGVLIKANWRVNGRQVEFTWIAASGNQGYGRGIISEDYNAVQYEAVDHLTGMQDTGRLVRSRP